MVASGEPRYIWITAILRPPNSRYKDIFRLITKYNEVLDTLVAETKHTHYLKISTVNELYHFDHGGRLTASGMEQFWKEIDTKIKDLNRGEDDLLSPSQTSTNKQSLQEVYAKRNHLKHDNYSNATSNNRSGEHHHDRNRNVRQENRGLHHSTGSSHY